MDRKTQARIAMGLLFVPLLAIHLFVRVVRALRAAAWELAPQTCAMAKYFFDVAVSNVENEQKSASREDYMPWFLRDLWGASALDGVPDVSEDSAVPSDEEIERKVTEKAADVEAEVAELDVAVGACNLIWSESLGRYKYRSSEVWKDVIASIHAKIDDRVSRRNRCADGGFPMSDSTLQRYDELNKEIDNLFALLNATIQRGYITPLDKKRNSFAASAN